MLKPNDISVPDGFDLWQHIHRGSMLELQDPDVDWDLFYADYERAYLERDVRDLVNVKDEGRHSKRFSARSGGLRPPSRAEPYTNFRDTTSFSRPRG